MKKPLNIADWISVYRIAASVFLGLTLFAGWKIVFACLLFLSLFSDMLDGYVARKLKICTARGARLDSLGDALTFVAAATGIWWFEKDFLDQNKMLVFVAVVPYVIQILLAVILFRHPTSYHTYLAKTAALFQGVFMLLLFFYGPVYWLFYAAVAVTVLETSEELILLFVADRDATNVKGLFWVLRERRKRGNKPR